MLTSNLTRDKMIVLTNLKPYRHLKIDTFTIIEQKNNSHKWQKCYNLYVMNTLLALNRF